MPKKVQEEVKENDPEETHEEPSFAKNIHLVLLIAAVAVLLGVQFMTATAMATAGSAGGTYTVGSLNLEYGAKKTLKPMPLAAGEQPAIANYRTRVKSLPTISELQLSAPTGDVTQDLVNNVIPKGTPWYGEQARVTFDDPITSQKNWGTYRSLKLSPELEQRWNTIAGTFTCDYCCGSPQRPTIITQCGCAHARAAQGMARWFLSSYGDTYTNEEIYGEMARWYALWYPGPTVTRIIQESQS